jgi:hypothetical protein
LPDRATEELRELVRYRDRLAQDFGDRSASSTGSWTLGFPEFTRSVRDLGRELATVILNVRPRPTPASPSCRISRATVQRATA